MRLRIDSIERNLDNLYSAISSVDDDEVKAHLSKYFCVRISGYVENTVKILLNSYVERSSPKSVSAFVQHELKNLTNLTDDKLKKILKCFNDDWESSIDIDLTEQQRSSLNSVISNRNNIAHGQPDSISFKLIGQYYADLKDITKKLQEIIR